MKHAKDDRNRRYLIDVAAFDKLNHNSRIYNDPYTITMTDITGTEKVATNLYLGTKAPLSTVTEGHNEYAVSSTTDSHPGGYQRRRELHDRRRNETRVLHIHATYISNENIDRRPP